MDAAYSAEVLRALELLRVALISANRPDADRVAREVERYVIEFLGGGRGE